MSVIDKIVKYSLKTNIRNKSNYAYSYLLCMISIMGSFILLESYYGLKNTIKGFQVLLLNILIYLAIFAFFYLLCVNVKRSCKGLVIFTWIFGLINYYAQIFRGGPFIASDIFSLGTAADVAGSYSIMPDYLPVTRSIGYFLLLVICVSLPSSKRLFPKNIVFQRVVALAVIIFVGWFYFISNETEKLGMSKAHTNYREVYTEYGSYVAFVLSIKELLPHTPEGYSLEEVNRIVREYGEFDEGKYNNDINIIVVVNESYSELDTIREIGTNEDYIPFVHSLNDNVIRGTLVASIWGGNTANSEYEFLTGNSMAFYPFGSVAFQLMDRELPSIVKVLNEDGYCGLNAYHPGKEDSWKRPQAYDYLGFDNFYYKDKFDEIRLLRNYATDSTLYNQLIGDFKTLYKQSDKPVFEYGITIQNHGGYDKWEDVPEVIKITDSKIQDKQLELYLNLLKETDKYLENLINYFSSISSPTAILFFGDHQPKLSESVTNYLYKDDEMKKYVSPFYLWTNYDIDEKDIGPISINYLGAYLLSETGNAMSPYQQYLLKLRKDIPVITAQGYYGKDGRHYMLDDDTSPYFDEIRDYRYLQYYNMYEDSRDLDWFFGIQR